MRCSAKHSFVHMMHMHIESIFWCFKAFYRTTHFYKDKTNENKNKRRQKHNNFDAKPSSDFAHNLLHFSPKIWKKSYRVFVLSRSNVLLEITVAAASSSSFFRRSSCSRRDNALWPMVPIANACNFCSAIFCKRESNSKLMAFSHRTTSHLPELSKLY